MGLDPVQILHEIQSMLRLLPWYWIVTGIHITLATLAAGHAMLYKRDSRAALGWVSVCLFFPVVGLCCITCSASTEFRHMRAN